MRESRLMIDIVCPHCSASLPPDAFDAHMESEHPHPKRLPYGHLG